MALQNRSEDLFVGRRVARRPRAALRSLRRGGQRGSTPLPLDVRLLSVSNAAMLKYLVVDAFTDVAYTGNPAAVVWLPETEALSNEQQLKIAREFNLSETAFVQPLGDGRFGLRWFTPLKEVEICGHATLATCRALAEWQAWAFGTPARFQTGRQGVLTGARDGAEYVLDFPQIESEPVEVFALAGAALGGITVLAAAKSRHSLVLLLDDEAALPTLVPDFALLAQLHPHGVCVTAKSAAAGVDFVSRFFAPNYGIDEDPVCGSAHCVLGPFWRGRLGKHDLNAVQVSARGGAVRVVCPPNQKRLTLRGHTTITFSGQLRPPPL